MRKIRAENTDVTHIKINISCKIFFFGKKKKNVLEKKKVLEGKRKNQRKFKELPIFGTTESQRKHHQKVKISTTRIKYGAPG